MTAPSNATSSVTHHGLATRRDVKTIDMDAGLRRSVVRVHLRHIAAQIARTRASDTIHVPSTLGGSLIRPTPSRKSYRMASSHAQKCKRYAVGQAPTDRRHASKIDAAALNYHLESCSQANSTTVRKTTVSIKKYENVTITSTHTMDPDLHSTTPSRPFMSRECGKKDSSNQASHHWHL